MKTTVSIGAAFIAGVAISTTLAGGALAADFSGTWHVSATFTAGGQLVATATPVCKFQQTGHRLSGTCKGPNGLGPAVGSVNGASITWQWNHQATTARGATGSTQFRGTRGPDGVIRGSAASTTARGAVGTFTAQR